MIFVLILLAIAAAITLGVWCHEERESHGDGIAAGIICSIFLAIILAIPWSISYNTYVGSRAFYDITREQYSSAIVIYQDAAVIDMGEAAFTDLKYQGYQNNVAKFIENMRFNIVRYNSTVKKKRIMKGNPFFSWLIVAPDEDMKLIRMKTEYKEAKNELD
jgi:hypothetical protein